MAPRGLDNDRIRGSGIAFAAVGGVALLLLLLPFAGLPLATSWQTIHLARGDLSAVATSVVYSLAAVVIIVVLGTPLAYVLARFRFPGKFLVEILVLIPFLTPPLALGLLLATAYGPYGYLGRPLETAGMALTNSGAAFLLAQIYAAAPYYIIGARSAFETVPRNLERVSLTLGRGFAATFLRVTLPLSGLGLASAVAVTWIRALGEFGVALIIAYFPRGIPVKLWVNLQEIGIGAVYPLLWLLLLVGLPLPIILGAVSRRRLKS